MTIFKKDPEAVLDYIFDWMARTNERGNSNWLTAAETITSHTITATNGLVVASSSITDSGTSITIWLSGGTAGETYALSCRVTTSGGRTDERTVNIQVEQR